MNTTSTTLSLDQAASYLNCNKETVRRLAQANRLPAGKVGRKWIYIQRDLENYIRKQYSTYESVVQVVDNDEESLCQYTLETTSGGLNSLHQMEQEYDALLRLKTDNKR
ncbi:helix-turn-helix domain-containing protein [Thiomicrorhabdus lithotrophica]|uniref:Helix-turn-helix domain-containing protein n=1 Tax=Thiomicrorhabdus lithotrophica TaxID=2949997 RepID=A0ABY8CAP2_9GAMM|nr:helix-turn-helix domain-containing protein [Thiomicrorhabdus lithotrophica]WEJ61882.1 helix-turn-helix domain-containing protein [Thiomicrorhabdus lithotrophica]